MFSTRDWRASLGVCLGVEDAWALTRVTRELKEAGGGIRREFVFRGVARVLKEDAELKLESLRGVSLGVSL